MGQVLLVLVVALTVAAVVFGVTVLVSGRDPGLTPAEPDGRAVPLPGGRPLRESDVGEVRFDTALRGYRMAQVDEAMRRAAYDIGYKSELIGVLEAEVEALRDGRTADADALRRARAEAVGDPGVDETPAYAGPVDATADEDDATVLPAEPPRPASPDEPPAGHLDEPLAGHPAEPVGLRADAPDDPDRRRDEADRADARADVPDPTADARADMPDPTADPVDGRPGAVVRSESV
ncbi:DivIVA domain-containing protein [Micromonospora sp. CPCC 205711]|uniref:DivIVA domain-containing protein n=1 Tax=Micromonospora sp. CPCC 205547 TaxID=3122400 RepID=UPI002FF23DF1